MNGGNVQNEREKLLEKLQLLNIKNGGLISLSVLADFILADRKRIVEPLVKHKEIQSRDEWRESDVNIAIDESLKNAGVTV